MYFICMYFICMYVFHMYSNPDNYLSLIKFSKTPKKVASSVNFQPYLSFKTLLHFKPPAPPPLNHARNTF